MGKDVIVACDFSSREAVLAFLDKFGGEARKPYVKIGMELFYGAGPDIVREIKRRGHRIFLDLKLCDIPNTVKKSMAVLRDLDVDMTNLHAFGTIDMMKAAVEGLTRPDGTRPLPEVVMHYAQNARSAGLDGVVCSPLESPVVHENCGAGFITVTPGVRFSDGAVGDQVRVTTPGRARELGSDYIVVGRPITAAEDPVAAYRRCIEEFVG